MSIEQYQEIVASEINTNSSIEAEDIVDNVFHNMAISSVDVVNMLTMWGEYNRYRSQCGYKHISFLFESLYPCRNFQVIEKDVERIEAILLTLKNGKTKKAQQQYAILEAYYKGVDLVIDGYDWSQRLTIRDISQLLSIPKSTVSNRKKEAESYIERELKTHFVYLS